MARIDDLPSRAFTLDEAHAAGIGARQGGEDVNGLLSCSPAIPPGLDHRGRVGHTRLYSRDEDSDLGT